MVFFGEYQVSFTAPGRIVLPKKIRELLKGNVFVLTKGYNNCLAGYDKEDWEQRATEVMGTSLFDNENLDKKRHLFSSTSYLEIDDQGRFVIPKHLLQTISDKDVKLCIVGVGDHFEIWEQSQWNEYFKKIKN